MLFVLIAGLFVVSRCGDASEVQNCPENHVDKMLLSRLYRPNYLRSPLYRFKVLNQTGWSPPKTPFKEPQDFYALREKCLQSGELFVDPDFDAVDSSLYFNASSAYAYDSIEWFRPHDIHDNPKFIVNGTSRFDIVQGSEGDCWFMSVLANVASNDAIIAQNVPTDQSFDDKYCGIFHFRFWQMGHWVDVVVDDRLPTIYSSLRFASSSEKNEFWTALLEKAYAKLYGSYEALSGGYEYEAMEDLTGGVSVVFNLNDQLPIPDLFGIMQCALKRQSIITLEMEKKSTAEETKVVNKGLPNNHAYSVTAVKSLQITTPKKTEKVSLVRVRNPWGKREWTGPWRDGAREWDFVSADDKAELGLKKSNDGEYWMTYRDLVNTFDALSICLIDPEMLPAPNGSDTKPHWEMEVFKGEWVRGATAGGCSVDSLHQNPQYQIKLGAGNGDDELSFLFVGLMQESQRALRNFLNQEEQYLRVGFVIYQVENATLSDEPLSSEYIRQHKWFGTSLTYANWRDVTRLFLAPPGVYTIIPCTHHADVEGEFILRVVTEKQSNSTTLRY